MALNFDIFLTPTIHVRHAVSCYRLKSRTNVRSRDIAGISEIRDFATFIMGNHMYLYYNFGGKYPMIHAKYSYSYNTYYCSIIVCCILLPYIRFE